MRVLVCGGRDYAQYGVVYDTLDALAPSEVIHGNYRGADTLAKEWAIARGVPHLPFTAEWKKLGPAAGPIRNQRMLDEGKPDLVLAFPGDRGTEDMVRRAVDAGVPVRRVP